MMMMNEGKKKEMMEHAIKGMAHGIVSGMMMEKGEHEMGSQQKEGSPPLGSGERFRRLKEKLKRRGATNPGALAAWIGRKKYGNKKFQEMSSHGK